MPIRFRCVHCQQLHSISTRMAGRSVKCPVCGGETPVPESDSAAAAGMPSEGAAGAESSGRESEVAGASHASANAVDGGDAAAKSAVAAVGLDGADTEERPVARSGAQASAGEPPSTEVRPAAVRRWREEEDEDEDEGFMMRSGTSEFEEMDLTPMVDVTFLLLIFFMITASFSLQKTMPFPPPSPDEKGSQQTLQTLEDFEEDSVIVEIDENNVIFVEDTAVQDPAALVDALRDAKKSELVLTAHPDALHETVVRVVDAAQEVGMQKIRLAKVASSGF